MTRYRGHSLLKSVLRSFKSSRRYSLEPWIGEKGLQFKCTACGQCCRGGAERSVKVRNDIRRTQFLQTRSACLIDLICKTGKLVLCDNPSGECQRGRVNLEPLEGPFRDLCGQLRSGKPFYKAESSFISNASQHWRVSALWILCRMKKRSNHNRGMSLSSL